MTGRIKRYSSTENIFSNNQNKKKNNSLLNINAKRTTNLYSENLNDEIFKKGKKLHKFSIFNNKSSSCIYLEYFNPLINYKNEEKKEKKKIKRNFSNKDHFDNMMPTQFYKYTPHTKQSMFNYYLISQIDNLPGSRQSNICKILIKKGGKKTFNKNTFKESKINFRRNNNNKYFNKHFECTKIYEFDDLIISHRDMMKIL